MWVQVPSRVLTRFESQPCGFKSQSEKKNGFKTAKCNLPRSTKNSESGVKAWRIISSKQSGFLEFTFFFFFFLRIAMNL